MAESAKLRHVVHTFPPVIDGNCHTLILGSVPSVKSMLAGFYYIHPQNRFWRVMERLLGERYLGEEPSVRSERLLLHHIALYDSVYACDILGSSDSRITNIVPADIPALLAAAPITRIFCNGARSYAELARAHPQLVGIAQVLPSTSPANAAYSLDRLVQQWQTVRVQKPAVQEICGLQGGGNLIK